MRVPSATYRIQFTPAFRFEEAKGIASYLSALGVSDLYASPIFKARKGSEHGYDVVDPNGINPELGSEEDLRALADELKEHRMCWLQDIVPNHMAYDRDNAMLMHVLENGQHSPFSSFFDVDWRHPYGSIRGRILAPFLGRFFGEALEAGELRLAYDPAGLCVRYFDLRFPLRIGSHHQVFSHRLDELTQRVGEHHPDVMKLLGILHPLTPLPSGEEPLLGDQQVRFAKDMLWDLTSKSDVIRQHLAHVLEEFNGRPGDPASFDLLDRLLSGERFRLSFWKVATEEINYRRFFSINHLISLRVEDEEVFARSHELIFRLVRDGIVQGLRVDHIDGLYDPVQYLKRLKERAGGVYIVVEKILGNAERLPAEWPIAGTTGYDFLTHCTGVFCDTRNRKAFQRLYEKHTSLDRDYDDLVADKKRLIIGKHMAGDIDNLAHLLKGISGLDRYGRDITLYGLRRALVEVMTFFPVYRTYVTDVGVSEHDRLFIQEAVSFARVKNPGLFYELNFIEKCLLQEFSSLLSEEEQRRLAHFAMRFQQFTGPLMAKGFEDTFLYVFNRLVSQNDVGGDPKNFGTTVDAFHRFQVDRAEQWPHALCATSTHDTKRGEDVRARISVLSEIPGEWDARLRAWKKFNRKKKTSRDGRRIPEENDEYFLYQTLLGAWPATEGEVDAFVQRIKDYVIKAVREAKVHTAWLKPDEKYENAFLSFVDAVLDRSGDNAFLADFLPFQQRIAYHGMLNALSQTLIKIASPGVPDFYQGTELWDLNLVDPDNRRPVDYDLRKRLLARIDDEGKKDPGALITLLLASWPDGAVKLFLTSRCLRAQQENGALFADGAYLPILARGEKQEHLIAFARQAKGAWAIAVAPRLTTGLVTPPALPVGSAVWGETLLPLPEGAPSLWRDAIAGETIRSERDLLVRDVLRRFPAALLISSAND